MRRLESCNGEFNGNHILVIRKGCGHHSQSACSERACSRAQGSARRRGAQMQSFRRQDPAQSSSDRPNSPPALQGRYKHAKECWRSHGQRHMATPAAGAPATGAGVSACWQMTAPLVTQNTPRSTYGQASHTADDCPAPARQRATPLHSLHGIAGARQPRRFLLNAGRGLRACIERCSFPFLR